ncbi:aspartic peptidase domain-containing protein [Podospora didyma]|uniref:Aspartic peptidase domain-containing protein n=1 Tax=Podospora didyma TaxID=330526 RepID=A0AAE0NRP1_9PEZI|nr:aspartic peptidase domain-containing protein [Podospora didyma]
MVGILAFSIFVLAPCLAAAAASNEQRPLTKNPSLRRSSGAVRIREALWYDVGYSLNISVGSPPQEIEVYLDISSHDSWIEPTDINPRDKLCKEAAAFDTAASTSFVATNTFARFHFDWMWGKGNLSYDTVGFGGGVAAADQAFAVPEYVSGDGFGFNTCPMAGIIGLAPFSSRRESDDFGEPSSVVSMVRQGVLERNLFAMRLRDPGAELSFGRVNNDLFQGGGWLAEVPLTRNVSGKWDGGWQTTASFLSIEVSSDDDDDDDDNKKEKSFQADLGGVPATFTTRDRGIHVPEALYHRIYAAAGFQHGGWFPPTVDCTNRFAMPNITFTLEGDQNLTLTAFDYTEPWQLDGPDYPPSCTCMFYTSSGFHWSKEIILGSSFLRKYYTVFDLDTDTIRFSSSVGAVTDLMMPSVPA